MHSNKVQYIEKIVSSSHLYKKEIYVKFSKPF